VKDVDELPGVLKEAFYIARTARPGPVLIDLPRNVQTGETSVPYPEEVQIRSYNPNYKGNPKQIRRAAEAIDKSERPVIYAGGGVISSGASSELAEFAGRINIPVTTTLMGLGSFPEDDPLSLKMLGMHGTRYANYAVSDTDLLIAVGARFDDRITGKISEFASHAKIIHIDIDPTAISKNVRVDIPIVGDAKNILSQLLSAARKGKKRESWHQRTFISSGGLGTMGYGFPASIGAQIGRPEKIVFDIAGDGSFQMNIQELATAVNYKVPVKIAILNNGYLGMVRQWQQLFYESRYSQVNLEGHPDFVKVAQA